MSFDVIYAALPELSADCSVGRSYQPLANVALIIYFTPPALCRLQLNT